MGSRAARSAAGFAPVGVALLVLTVTLLFVFIDRPVDAQNLETRAADLASMRRQIAVLHGRLEAVSSRETTLEDELGRVEAERELQELRLGEATAALELADAQATATEERIAQLEASIALVRDDLRRRLVGLYRLGGHGYLRFVLALEADDDLLPVLRQLRYLVRRDRRAIDRWQVLGERLEGERAALAARRAEADAWRGREQVRRDELAAAESRRREVLERVGRERRRLAAETEALEAKARKLSRFVAALGGASEDLLGEPLDEFRGVLDWPADGEVAIGFGPRRERRYRTEVPHNGLTLTTDPGSRVRAVFPGEVRFAADFEGYGPTVIVQHAGRAFTLYAGLALLNVEKGEVISLGDVVGAASDSLYFEIRVRNEPRDPRAWLR
ncbi:MAG: peptidoglycan DD-metalloendopeptidase family protein [Acidobacteriota bacterium]